MSPTPNLPDNSRRPRGSNNPRNVSRKLWVDHNEARLFKELSEVYNSSESALIRWLIQLGIERVSDLAETDALHRELHEQHHSSLVA